MKSFENNHGLKSRTISFRIPEIIITDIEKEARTKLVSTNVLLNQILLQYVQWDRYQHKMRMFPIPEEILHQILGNMDEKLRSEAIEITFNSIRDWALMSNKKFDIHACLQVLEEYCRMVGISVEEDVDSGLRSFVIKHNLGPSMSSFIDVFIKKIFWDVAKINIDCQSTNTMVVIKFSSKFD